jgi:sigma-B regulation protein RsbU (phosphoserine phosphatase)
VDDTQNLKNKIKLLEKELELKNKDLEIYRKELMKANEQLETLVLHIHTQLKKALEIQRQVVPTEFPHIPGFEFSSKFLASSLMGGDYFDIFEHRDRMQFGLLMSSASGYSISALFLSLFMKFTFASRQDVDGQTPQSLLASMKEDLVSHLSEKDQFHFFYGVMNRRHLRLELINVGSVLAVHYVHATQSLKRLQFSAPPLTKDYDMGALKIETVDFEPKDKLILCSPGLLKISNSKGEFFGEERFYSIIKKSAQSDVHNLRNEIFFQAQQFSADKNLPQDLTAIVVEAKERVLKLASV